MRFLILIVVFGLFVCFDAKAQPLSGILPKYDANIYTNTVYLEWNSVPNVIDYQVELSQDPSFVTGVNLSPIIFSTNWTSVPLTYGTWYWRVIANTTSGNVIGSVEKFSYFDPSQISYLSCWLDASQGITLDGSNKVQTWQDQSSNNFTLNQSNPIERPIMNISSLNGLPSLLFSGNDFLEGGDILDLRQNSRSMFLIGKMNGTSVQSFFAKSFAGSAFARYALIRNLNNNSFIYQEASVVELSTPAPIGGEFGFINLICNRAISQNSISVNNQLPVSGGPVSTADLNSTFRFLVGAHNANPDISELSLLNGEISEIIFTDGPIIETDNLKINTYLRDKYVQPLNLGEDIVITTNYCDTMLLTNSGFTNFIWSTGETTPTITVNIDGYYWVQATDLFGFDHYDTIHVSYPTIPAPTFTGICVNETMTWNADMGPGHDYLWSPNGETTPSISITSSGTYSVQVTDAFMCSRNSGNYTFGIDNYSQTAYIGNDTILCSGNLIALQVGASETISYLWPDASAGINYEVDTTGNYFVETVNVNGCIAQDTIHITITGQAPAADFSFQDQCFGLENAFTDLSEGVPTDPIVLWDWDFGDGNTDNTQNPSYTYGTTGTFTVQLYVESTEGCGAFHTEEVSIFALPTANFTDVGHCSGQSVQFTNISTVGDAPISAYLWNFDQPWLGAGDTSILVSPVSTFDAAGNYNISLQVTDTNGCTDTFISPLTIDQSPTVAFTASDECLNTPITFTNTSVALSPETYLWDFGDLTSSILPIPFKNYETIGIHTINLTVTASNECFNTLQQQITVHPNPVAVMDVGPMCMGTYTSLTDNSIIASGSIASSLWILNSTDTVTGLSNVFEFNSLGQQQVVLETTSNFGCTSTESQFFDITESLEASFTTTSAITAVGEPITFTNTTSGSSIVSWDFGDGNNLNFVSPATHIYGANYLDSIVTVSMFASNDSGCQDTAQVSIEIRIPILDLATTNLLVQENGSLWIIGVELKNVGSITVKKANLQVQLPDGPVIVELWNGNLIPGQNEIYVFNSLINEYIPMDTTETFVCVESVGYDINNNTEVYLDNNKACKNIDGVDVLLLPIYPNPANNNVTIELLVTVDSDVSLEVIDSRGRLVKTILPTQTLDAGFHSYDVDISQIQSGSYILRMKNDDGYSSYELLIANY